MLIGELARASGASPRMLRHYEAQGLIAAQRSASGHRAYDTSAVERVQLIRQFLSAGLPVVEVAEMLRTLTDPSQQDTAIDERLISERNRLSEQLDVLQRQRDALNAIVLSNMMRRASMARAPRRP